MMWPTSGTNWANAQIDTPRALFHHKGLPWDCPLLCFKIFQESISWDLSQHSGICGSEDLKGFQETSSQLTQNKSAEIFPNITLQKQLYKTFIHIFFEYLQHLEFGTIFKVFSSYLQIYPSIFATDQAKSVVWRVRQRPWRLGGNLRCFFFGAGFSFHRIHVWHIYLHWHWP